LQTEEGDPRRRRKDKLRLLSDETKRANSSQVSVLQSTSVERVETYDAEIINIDEPSNPVETEIVLFADPVPSVKDACSQKKVEMCRLSQENRVAPPHGETIEAGKDT
jgi:hypothetical protein